MKKIITLFFCLVVSLSFTGQVFAQDKPVTKIVSAKQNGKEIDFNLSSSKPFIFGSNRYELHVGTKVFYRNTQSSEDGKGSMTFFIPAGDYSKLSEGASIYLCYGRVTKNNAQNMEELSKQSRKCWSLGKFSKKLMTK